MAFAAEHSTIPFRARGPSWPPGLGFVPIGLILNAHGHKQGLLVLAVGLAITFFGAGKWWSSLLLDRFVGRDLVDADSRQKRAFLMFILSEAAIFSAFFAAILYSRAHLKVWPPEGMPHFEVLIPAINTFLLVTSSVTLHLGHTALERGRRTASSHAFS
jgi:hypothetical protein